MQLRWGTLFFATLFFLIYTSTVEAHETTSYTPNAELSKVPKEIPLLVLVHLQKIADVKGLENEWVGTKGQARRLQGFSICQAINFDKLPIIEYMAHLQGSGDTDFIREGLFIGTRGQARRLQGFAIRLVGQYSQFYDVIYQAHIQQVGDTQQFKNGQFCGTRGESKRVEAIKIRIIKKQGNEISKK